MARCGSVFDLVKSLQKNATEWDIKRSQMPNKLERLITVDKQ